MPTAGDPERVWNAYVSQFSYVHSLAFDGNVTIESEAVYESGLQVFYQAPDSFAFMAEGTLGVDLVRGALVSDSGFWEIPRERVHKRLEPGERVNFENQELQINIAELLDGIFFFRNSADFGFLQATGARFVYRGAGDNPVRIIELSRDSATPTRQFLYTPDDTVEIQYSDWRTFSGHPFPYRVRLHWAVSGLRVEYVVSRVSVNPTVPQFYFWPQF